MAIGRYRGVNGVAHKVTKRYKGVSGVARNITKGYRGVNGVARKYFESTQLKVVTSYVASSRASGLPNYYATVDSSGRLCMKLSAYRSSETNYDTDRNTYNIAIQGINSGDVVSFKFEDSSAPAMTAIDILHNGTTVKSWNTYGSRTYTFTASGKADMLIVMTDGSYHNELNCYLSNLTINGRTIDLSRVEITGDKQIVTYKWNRYTVGTTTSYKIGSINIGYPSISETTWENPTGVYDTPGGYLEVSNAQAGYYFAYLHYGTSVTINRSTGLLTLSGTTGTFKFSTPSSGTSVRQYVDGYTSYPRDAYCYFSTSSTISPVQYVFFDNRYHRYSDYNEYNEFFTHSGSGSGSTQTFTLNYNYEPITGILTSTQGAGSYIDQVTSASQSTYPTNGISGSYWYYYQGYTITN